MKKLSVDELLRLACIYAERDQEEYTRAITGVGMEEELAETEAFIKQLREYRLKRWGATKLEAAMEAATPVNVQEIAARTPVCGCERCGKQLFADSCGNFEIDYQGREPVMKGVCYACLRPEED